MPVPVRLTVIVEQLPPPVGHSKRSSVPPAAPTAVGLKVSLMLQLPLEGLQVSKLSEKGGLMPAPEAPKMPSPAATVIATSRVTDVLIGTFPKSTVAGSADPAFATAGAPTSPSRQPMINPARRNPIFMTLPSQTTADHRPLFRAMSTFRTSRLAQSALR